MTIDYGFATTDEVRFDPIGLPIGEYNVLITDEKVSEKLDENNPNPVIAEYEVLSGDNKGKTGRVYYNVHHSNQTTANIAKQAIKRIAEATGKPVSQTSPLKGRVLKVIVDWQKNSDRYTEIKKYLPFDDALSSVASASASKKEDDIPFA